MTALASHRVDATMAAVAAHKVPRQRMVCAAAAGSAILVVETPGDFSAMHRLRTDDYVPVTP